MSEDPELLHLQIAAQRMMRRSMGSPAGLALSKEAATRQIVADMLACTGDECLVEA